MSLDASLYWAAQLTRGRERERERERERKTQTERGICWDIAEDCLKLEVPIAGVNALQRYD